MGNPIRNIDGFLAGASENDMPEGVVFEARSNNKGILIPRVTTSQRDAITVGSDQNGMLVYVTDSTPPGFQFYDHPSTSWKPLTSGDFIPLSGTEIGRPATGIFEFSGAGINSVNDSFYLVASDNRDWENEVTRYGGLIVHSSVSESKVSITAEQNGKTAQIQSRTTDLSSEIKISGTAGFKGAEYVDDYSSEFTDRSLVDKEYVDNAVSSGGGETNLSYTPSPTNGSVNSDTGTDATIPLVDGTNAGLQAPGDYTTFNTLKSVNGLVKSNGSGSFSAVVSGTDIKTVNGNSILGSGNISVGAGDVTGPGSSTDNRIARMDGTTGKVIQESTASITDLGEILLPSNAAPTYANGKLAYDSDNDALTFFNSNNNVALQIGQEQWIRVRNVSGSTIANGAAVYINGSNSGLPTIALAQANSGTTTVCAGIATQSIPNNAVGFVTSIGAVRGLNTSAFSVGAVYLSATTPGALTQTIPSAPNFRYRVGFVTTVNASTGTIHVTPSTADLANGTNGQIERISSTGTKEYFTPNYAPQPSWMRQATDRTLTSQTAPQKLFNVGASGNGAFQAKANTSYHFVIMAGLNSLSSTSSSFSFVFLGTASMPTLYATAQAVKNNNGPANTSTTKMLSNTETTITVSSALTNGRLVIEGYFTTGTAGTVIPAIGLSTAAAGVVEANSFARFVEVGSSSFTASSDID